MKKLLISIPGVDPDQNAWRSSLIMVCTVCILIVLSLRGNNHIYLASENIGKLQYYECMQILI